MSSTLSALKSLIAESMPAHLTDEPGPTETMLAEILRDQERESERQAELDTLATLRMAPLTNVTPENVATLRARTMRIVEKHLISVDAVLSGQKIWTNSQVSLFRSLMSKVMPDVHHTEVSVGVETRPMTELSREELEAIVAQERQARTKVIEAADIIDERIVRAQQRKSKAKETPSGKPKSGKSNA